MNLGEVCYGGGEVRIIVMTHIDNFIFVVLNYNFSNLIAVSTLINHVVAVKLVRARASCEKS